LKKDEYKSLQNSADIQFIYAGILTSVDDVKDAEKIYQHLIASERTIESYCDRLAQIYIGQKKMKEALELLENCGKKDPEQRSQYLYKSGRYLVDSGNVEKAEKYFLNSYQADQTNTRALVALSILWTQLKQEQKTEKAFVEHLKSYPKDAMINQRLSEIYIKNNKIEKALPLLESLADQKNIDLRDFYRLGLVYAQLKDHEKALDVFLRLKDIDPENDSILLYVASTYSSLENHEQALRFYTEIKPESSFFKDATIQSISAYESILKQDFKEETANSYEKFLKERSKHANIYFETILSSSLYQYQFKKNFQAAIELMSKLTGHESFNLDHRIYLASLYEKTKQYVEVDKLLEPAVSADTENAEVLNYLGYSHLEREGGDMNKAHDYLSRAIKLSPESGYIRDSWGWYLFKIGKYEEAVTELIKAKKLLPTDHNIYLHLAEAYEKLLRFDKALESAQESLKLIGESREKETVEIKIKYLNDLSRKPSSK
jgi:tetratricopeptide (TPR) repeat protein